jgi:hypothetical protein
MKLAFSEIYIVVYPNFANRWQDVRQKFWLPSTRQHGVIAGEHNLIRSEVFTAVTMKNAVF